jgi:hypothetical protein
MGNTPLKRHDRPRPDMQHAKAQRTKMNVPQAIIDGLHTNHFAAEWRWCTKPIFNRSLAQTPRFTSEQRTQPAFRVRSFG